MELCQGSSDVNHRRSFADTAFEDNECQDSSAHENPLSHIAAKHGQLSSFSLPFRVRRAAFGVQRSAGMMEDSSAEDIKNHLLSTKHLHRVS
jgi:hypothetical protein